MDNPMTKTYTILLCLSLMFLFTGCQPKPWQDETRCLDAQQTGADSPYFITVDGEQFCVDSVLEDELCDADLSGIVYVEDEIKVAEWEEAPNFLAGCNFQVAPGTIILVGYHNNTPYYKGCASCHDENAPAP
jgi:hypothetical protein